MTDLEVVSWEDDAPAIDSVNYDTAILGPTAAVETETVLCNRLVPRLCEEQNIPGLQHLAEAVTEIPEQHLVAMIFTALNADSPERDSALDAMLRHPFTPATLTAALRQRHLSDVARLAGHVTDRLRTADSELAEALTEWLPALLDSQYANLLVAEDDAVRVMLEKLTSWRDQQEHVTKEAGLLLRELDQLKAQRQRPLAPPVADYCVEVLNL